MEKEDLDSIIEQLESGVITDESLKQEREELSKMPAYLYEDLGDDDDEQKEI